MKVVKSEHGNLYVATHNASEWCTYTATGHTYSAAMNALYILMRELG